MTAPTAGGPDAVGQAGPLNSLADIEGLLIGHHTATSDGCLTGTTVVLAPAGGMTAGVDVRGGAPGTRETDLLHPIASVQRIHAIVLTGGSAYGLAAADGVAEALGRAGIGFAVGGPGEVVPIVPAAVLFDLGRGGSFAARPTASFGEAAVAAALATGGTATATANEVPADPPQPGRLPGPLAGGRENGLIGAGTGAVSCGIKSGLGTASAVLQNGTMVAALVVANAVGSPVDRRTGELLGARLLLPADSPPLRRPAEADRLALLAVLQHQPRRPTAPDSVTTELLDEPAPLLTNTTIGIVATDAALTKAQCTKMAGIAQDGLARALNPVHTQFDGDTLFGVSTGQGPAPDDFELFDILCAAADVVTRALVNGLLAAATVSTPAGTWHSYTDLAPSALALVSEPRAQGDGDR